MDFKTVLARFTRAVESNDGEGLAGLFLPDGVYVDGFYGDFVGRPAIAHMLNKHFWGHARDFRWDMLDPVHAGTTGYARYVFSYTYALPEAAGRRVVFEGMSRFEFEGTLIRRYTEIFDRGLALSQLGFAAERIAKVVRKAADRQNARPECAEHLGPTSASGAQTR